MHRFSMFVVASTAALGLVGCGQMTGSSSMTARGGMAVIDLDKVAAETGRDRQLTQSLELAQNSLNQSLTKTVESAKEQLEAKKKGYGDDLTDDEKQEFSALERTAVTQLSQIQTRYRADFEQFKQKQIAQFRADLKPIAQEVAAKRGLSVVIPKNDGLLLSVDSGVDITDDVIKLLRERRPTPTPKIDAEGETPAQKPIVKRKNTAPARTAETEREDESVR